MDLPTDPDIISTRTYEPLFIINRGYQSPPVRDSQLRSALHKELLFSGVKVFDLTQQYDLTIEEVDALTGALIGRPNTGTYRLQDLVGLDTGEKVTQFVMNNVQNDSFFETYDYIQGLKRSRHLLT